MPEKARKRLTFQLGWLVLVLATAGAGCKDVIERVTRSVERVELPRLSPPDDAGVERFAHALSQAAQSGKLEALVALVDADLLAERATLGLELPPEAVQRLRRQLFDAAKVHGIFRMLIDSAVQGGGLRYLEAESELSGGQRWAMFRVLLPDAGFDYYSLLLTRRADGSVRAVDWQLLSQGESVSSLMRRLLLSGQGDRLRALAALLSDEEAALLRHTRQISEMQQASQAGNSQRALEIFESMPQPAQRLPLVLLTRLNAAHTLGDNEYRAALEGLVAQQSNDLVARVHDIDLHSLQRDHAGALQAIDRLSARVGPDPYFHVLRATTLLQMNDVAGARSEALQALQQEPDLDVARFTLVNIGLQRKDWADTARWIGELDARGAMDLSNLRTTPGFTEFAASKAYAALLASAERPPERAAKP